MSYEPPPQHPSFNPPQDPGYSAADYDRRQAGQAWEQQPTLRSSHRMPDHRSSSFTRHSSHRRRSVVGYGTLSWAWPGSSS